MKLFKSLLLFALTASLYLSAFACAGLTEREYNASEDSYFEFVELEDGTYAVKASDVANLPKTLNLPVEHDGVAVTAVAENGFKQALGVEKLNVPANILVVGEAAFKSCESLKEVYFYNGVQEIGKEAFSYCTALRNVRYSSQLVSIGVGAFYQCASIERVTCPNKLKSIGALAYAGCHKLNRVVISANVENIGEGAFSYCASDIYFSISNYNKYFTLDENGKPVHVAEDVE